MACGETDSHALEFMAQLYKMQIRPQLEYYMQFWSPQCRKVAIAQNWVLRKDIRLLPMMEIVSYDERLDRC